MPQTKEELREFRRRYRLKNRDRIIQLKRKFYQAHKKELIQKQREYYHKNRLASQGYYSKNRLVIISKALAYYKKTGLAERRQTVLRRGSVIFRGLNKRSWTGKCELCGVPREKNLNYHHWDDTNLNIGLWLCTPCHQAIHGNNNQAVDFNKLRSLQEKATEEVLSRRRNSSARLGNPSNQPGPILFLRNEN